MQLGRSYLLLLEVRSELGIESQDGKAVRGNGMRSPKIQIEREFFCFLSPLGLEM